MEKLQRMLDIEQKKVCLYVVLILAQLSAMIIQHKLGNRCDFLGGLFISTLLTSWCDLFVTRTNISTLEKKLGVDGNDFDDDFGSQWSRE